MKGERMTRPPPAQDLQCPGRKTDWSERSAVHRKKCQRPQSVAPTLLTGTASVLRGSECKGAHCSCGCCTSNPQFWAQWVCSRHF